MSEFIPILQPLRRESWRLTRPVAIGLSMVVVLVGACYAWWHSKYPYGSSHACDKILYFALTDYARSHNGEFPTGEETPEASMSLIYGAGEFDRSWQLCGKRLSQSRVKGILDRGELLGPETCGWNYVEGLREDDDDRLALFWDKDGLDHSGGRLPGGGHMVMFGLCTTRYITAAEWPEFLRQQEELWAKLRESGRKVRMSEAGRTPAGAKP